MEHSMNLNNRNADIIRYWKIEFYGVGWMEVFQLLIEYAFKEDE
ncbi:hypothetical protein EDD68_1187 [Melghiribacillus thermohalophilus]|uniref:Uncharacterized protein n=1 Tax=Melghiribacillus thermohalophilus TaxID=1324956 RepID=A0A4R3MSR8_9BACI|nr:hypothetical protein EDD68_1187 [Melghiribacillus thermohalophilus]